MITDFFYLGTETEEPALVADCGDRQLCLNSTFAPEHEAKRWAESIPDDGVKRAACLFGVGTGLFAVKLLEKLTPDSRLIIYEPERAVIDFIESQRNDGETEGKIAARIERILSDDRVILCIEKDMPGKFEQALIENINFYNLDSTVIARHTMYDRLYRDSFAHFLHAVGMNRERILVNKNTMARFRDNASDNVLRNMWIVEKMNLVSELSKAGVKYGERSEPVLTPDIPVIIVSAGPSLDKNIEQLKTAKGHCLILAVDTAIKHLMKRDIMPDLTITVEPIKPVEHYADRRTELIPAIFDIESNPEIVGKHKSRVLLYNCRDYVKNLLEAVGKQIPENIPSGGSVATAAFATVRALGSRTVIMIGQDLAYSGESTHAGGVESKGINNDIGYEMIDGYYGEKVRSRSDWLGYLRWFESSIESAHAADEKFTVIDATEGGAAIKGTIRMPLAEAIDKYCRNADGSVLKYNFEEKLSALEPFLNADEYAGFLKVRADAVIQLDEMCRKASRAAELCGQLISKGALPTKEEAESLNGIRHFCESTYAYPLINNYAVSGIADEVKRLANEGAGDAHLMKLNVLKQQKLAFEAIADACARFGAMRK